MAASRQDIERWFENGVALGAGYMLVICDTFDHSDYPVYCATEDDARTRMKTPGEMQRLMECYDLSADKTEQMNQRRAMALTV